MKLKLAVYNMEWMKDLFFADGTPKKANEGSKDDRKHGKRSELLASVVQAIDPDVLCIVEGPNTLADGSKTASAQLEAWCDLHDLDADYEAVHGIPSGGQQELCALFKKSKIHLVHDPEGKASKHPFDEPFLVDTMDTLIKAQYKHYRPPLELSLREPGGAGDELARLIVVHTKSKGIFDSVDLARFEQLSERNRRKLYAECYSVRERCDQWFDEQPGQKIIVTGDVNDGFGLDYYEQRFSRSAVEILLGDVWEPDKILRQVLPRPKLGKYGWNPSSSRYQDRITGDYFNVLIDHILLSQSIVAENARVWNPFLKDAPDDVKALKKALKDASDHFPVSVQIEI
jgi:hypothetical protein